MIVHEDVMYCDRCRAQKGEDYETWMHVEVRTSKTGVTETKGRTYDLCPDCSRPFWAKLTNVHGIRD